MVCQALDIRKRMQGISDQDLDSSPSSVDELASQIDYLVGFIIKKTGSQFQEEIARILISSDKLDKIKGRLLQLVAKHKLVQKRERRLNGDEEKAVNILKQTSNLQPCLGPGIVVRTGR